VTDAHAIAIVEEVLDQGDIVPRIVATINEFGGSAEGFLDVMSLWQRR